MTAQELFDKLSELSSSGYDLDVPVFFDTEAKMFHYHMAHVGKAYYETEPYPHMSLHEESK